MKKRNLSVTGISKQIEILKIAFSKYDFVLNREQLHMCKELEESGIEFFIYPIFELKKIKRSCTTFFENLLIEQGEPDSVLVVPYQIFEKGKKDDAKVIQKSIELRAPRIYTILGEFENQIFSFFSNNFPKKNLILAGVNPAYIL